MSVRYTFPNDADRAVAHERQQANQQAAPYERQAERDAAIYAAFAALDELRHDTGWDARTHFKFEIERTNESRVVVRSHRKVLPIYSKSSTHQEPPESAAEPEDESQDG